MRAFWWSIKHTDHRLCECNVSQQKASEMDFLRIQKVTEFCFKNEGTNNKHPLIQSFHVHGASSKCPPNKHTDSTSAAKVSHKSITTLTLRQKWGTLHDNNLNKALIFISQKVYTNFITYTLITDIFF